MTAIPKMLAVAALFPIAGLAGCSSTRHPAVRPPATTSPAGVGTAPALSRWSGTLNRQMAAASKVCITPNTPDCRNQVEAVHVILDDIRKDLGSASTSPRYASLLGAMDAADQDHGRFRDMHCGALGNEMNCMMLVARISQDVTKVLAELGQV